MSKIWKVNNELLTDLGISVAAGNFQVQGASMMTLERAVEFDAAQILSYGAAVTLTHQEGVDGTPVKFFQGRVVTVPKFASSSAEGQVYEVADAWHDLERCIYQEPWGFGEVAAEADPPADPPARVHLRVDIALPKTAFGMDTSGARISVGAQIARAVTYAASTGVAIQPGSIPTGEIPIPSEVTNVSCAEIIRMCLRLHPDWIPWIDHTTTPPTLNVTPVSTMTGGAIVSYAVSEAGTDGVTDFEVIRRDDLMPLSVRIVYDFAGEANLEGEPEIFRKAAVDKAPVDGPDEGPGVLVAAIPLQGMQMQTQKARLHCRTIPIVGTTPEAEAKKWLKMHYLHLTDVPDAEFSLDAMETVLMSEPEDFPDPINPRAERLSSPDVEDYPRELVRGSVEDWMRLRVGKVICKPAITITGGSAAAQAAAAMGFQPFSVVATNGRTKTYHGASQWVAPEDIPVGVASAVYNAIRDGCQWQGSITIEAEDIPTTMLLGKKCNITGTAETEIATMNAPIQGVSWDVDTGRAVIQFGPVAYLAPVDFLELQRLFRQLPVKWWSADERTSDQIGSDEYPSAAGDTVNGFDQPEVMHTPGGGGAVTGPVPLHILRSKPAYIPEPVTPVAEGFTRYWIEWGTYNGLLSDNWTAHFDLNATKWFFAVATLRTTGGLKVLSWEVVTGATDTSEETPDWVVGEPRPASAVKLLGAVLVDDGVHTVFNDGGGSIVISEHVVSIEGGGAEGEVAIGKEIHARRETY